MLWVSPLRSASQEQSNASHLPSVRRSLSYCNGRGITSTLSSIAAASERVGHKHILSSSQPATHTTSYGLRLLIHDALSEVRALWGPEKTRLSSSCDSRLPKQSSRCSR